MTSNEVEET